ncbi:DUF397 domain-containing protein [Streptomyces sp. NPDC020875]|uniref:DUF397 domain-containing protein n=1 Tax=Streptomyces sp. NPDC020875 TaxID=3154898 RepID=UPI0033DEB601
MTEPQFFKSSYSANGGDCVEVAVNLADTHDTVPVRDSKNPTGPSLTVPAQAFSAFLTGIKADDFKAV